MPAIVPAIHSFRSPEKLRRLPHYNNRALRFPTRHKIVCFAVALLREPVLSEGSQTLRFLGIQDIPSTLQGKVFLYTIHWCWQIGHETWQAHWSCCNKGVAELILPFSIRLEVGGHARAAGLHRSHCILCVWFHLWNALECPLVFWILADLSQVFLEKCALELLFWMPPISWSICRVHNQDKHPNQIIFRKHRFYYVFVRWQQQIYIAKLCHSQAFLHWWISVCWNGSSTLQKVAQLWCHYIRITLIQCSNSVKFSQQFVCVRPLSVDDQFTIILTSVQFCPILSNFVQSDPIRPLQFWEHRHNRHTWP